MKIDLKAVFGLLIASSSIALAPAQAQPPTPGAQWPSFNNRLDGQRFSPLKEITPANASRLHEVCRVGVDGPVTFEAGLLVDHGVIYTDTARETVAIDATTCQVRWRFTYVPDGDRAGGSNRGVALMDGRLFRGTGDARLLALDAATGKLLWKDVIGTPRLGEGAQGVPLAANGIVYLGISGSESGIRGRVMAFDAQSGRELWRFNTIPMGAERGATTWKSAQTARTGGGGVWGAMSLDVSTGELFVPVGNPWPDIDNRYRPGSNLFTDSIVALDPRTGALKWWHQVTPADWRDMDLVAAPVLYRDSEGRDILAFAGKDGYVTALDRDTHRTVFRTPVVTVQPYLSSATPQGVRICPGYAGGVEWNGPTLDRLSNTLVTGSVDACFIVKSATTPTKKYVGGRLNFGGSIKIDGPITGWVTSLDADTGRIRWQYHAEKPVIAGVTPTAGGVTFAGDLAGHLLVFNSKTGELVTRVQTGGALAGGVVTYETGGKQYVAFASGNVSPLAFGSLGLPSVVVMALEATRSGTGRNPAAAGARGE
jgi:alcohol dehydrogenase (cytochrome c)